MPRHDAVAGARGDDRAMHTLALARRASLTAPQWFCLLFGVGLTLRGIFGLTMTEFGAPSDGWHQVFHTASGVVLLAATARTGAARWAAFGFGVVYAVFAALGLAGVEGLFGLIEVGTGSNIQHGVYALIALVVAARGA